MRLQGIHDGTNRGCVKEHSRFHRLNLDIVEDRVELKSLFSVGRLSDDSKQRVNLFLNEVGTARVHRLHTGCVLRREGDNNAGAVAKMGCKGLEICLQIVLEYTRTECLYRNLRSHLNPSAATAVCTSDSQYRRVYYRVRRHLCRLSRPDKLQKIPNHTFNVLTLQLDAMQVMDVDQPLHMQTFDVDSLDSRAAASSCMTHGMMS